MWEGERVLTKKKEEGIPVKEGEKRGIKSAGDTTEGDIGKPRQRIILNDGRVTDGNPEGRKISSSSKCGASNGARMGERTKRCYLRLTGGERAKKKKYPVKKRKKRGKIFCWGGGSVRNAHMQTIAFQKLQPAGEGAAE